MKTLNFRTLLKFSLLSDHFNPLDMTGDFSFSDGNRKKKLHSFVTIEIFSREKFSQSKSSESVNSAVQTTLTIYKRNPRYIIVFTIRWLSIQCAGNSSQVHCYFLLIECEELMVGSSLLSCINRLLSVCSYLIITRLEFRDWTTPTNYYRRIFSSLFSRMKVSNFKRRVLLSSLITYTIWNPPDENW